MPGITGQGTTYNLPNYVGELFAVSREDTPLLSAIGGLTGGRSTTATLFEWQGYDLRDPDANRQRLEGADAPAGEERVRFHANNVVEIHQESVEISYTKQGATGNRSTDGMPTVSVGGTVIPADELGWQITQQLKQISRDVEASFITGTYRNPTDNTTPRKTRGLIEAITTNSRSTEHTAAQLTADDVLDLAQLAWDNGGIRETETRTIVVNSTLKRALTRAFVTDRNYREETRNVGGVNLQTIETDFGRFNIMLDPYVPKDKLLVLSLEELAPPLPRNPRQGPLLRRTSRQDRSRRQGAALRRDRPRIRQREGARHPHRRSQRTVHQGRGRHLRQEDHGRQGRSHQHRQGEHQPARRDRQDRHMGQQRRSDGHRQSRRQRPAHRRRHRRHRRHGQRDRHHQGRREGRHRRRHRECLTMSDETEQQPFATVADLEKRWYGRKFAGTDKEDHVKVLLEDASDLIRRYPGHRRCTEATLRRICCAVARRTLENEESDLNSNVTNMSETVGPVSQSYTFGNTGADMRLWPSEEKELGVGCQRAWSYDPFEGAKP